MKCYYQLDTTRGLLLIAELEGAGWGLGTTVMVQEPPGWGLTQLLGAGRLGGGAGVDRDPQGRNLCCHACMGHRFWALAWLLSRELPNSRSTLSQ